MKQKLFKTMLLLCALVAGSTSVWAVDETYASWSFASDSYPSNKTNFSANGGPCTGSTFYLNGSGSTWNTTKGYAFTAVTDITLTLKLTADLPAGSNITFSADTYYNKASNAPMKGFTLTASENGGAFGTTGLDVTSLSLSASSATKTCVYTTQAALTANQTIAIKYTQTGKAGSGQGYFNNIVITGPKMVAAGTTPEPTISGNTPFLGTTTVTITNDASADGADIYYTLNGEDPTTSTSATCFAYSAPFNLTSTTTVKAIAKHADDTNASTVVSRAFTKVTPITVAEAIAATPASGTSDDVCIHGYVSAFFNTSIVGDGTNYRYYISDDGTTTGQLLVYKGKGLGNVAFSNADDLLLGDEVVIIGGLTTYSSAPEVAADNYILSLVRKQAPTFSLDETTATLEAYTHETIDITLTTNTDGVITCESDDPDVATVALKSANVYTITAQTAGTATITISAAAGATYNAASATVEVTVNDSREDAGISFAEDAIEITWGDAFTGQVLTNTNSLDVVYSSTDETVATVNSTGVVTALKAGSTTIKASFAGNATYKAAIVSYDLTVNKAEAGISYAVTAFDVMLNDDSFVEPTLQNPNSLTVTYSSNNGSVALVDENDGTLALETSAEGTVTITATFAGNDYYNSGSAYYTITVIDPTVKGSKYNPYTVAEVIDGTATGSNIYVKGFIVGEYVGKTTNPRTSSFTTDANIAIADAFTTSPTAGGSIPVALPTSALKSAWGCQTNGTALFGYEVLIKGNKDTYFSVNGIKSTTEVTAVSVPVSVGSAGYTTYVTPEIVSFPMGVTAYIVTSVGTNSITLTEVLDAPAGTPLIIEADEDDYQLDVEDSYISDVSGNQLQASDGSQTGNGLNIYALGKKSDVVGFYLVNDGQTIPAGKAYIVGPNYTGVKEFLTFSFEDDADGINAIDNGELTIDNAAIYNLAGQRLSKMQKGINIVNGKKILK